MKINELLYIKFLSEVPSVVPIIRVSHSSYYYYYCRTPDFLRSMALFMYYSVIIQFLLYASAVFPSEVARVSWPTTWGKRRESGAKMRLRADHAGLWNQVGEPYSKGCYSSELHSKGNRQSFHVFKKGSHKTHLAFGNDCSTLAE